MSEETSVSPSEESSENKRHVDDAGEGENSTANLGHEIADVRPKNQQQSETKVELILKPVADAPIMKQKKWSLPGSRTIGWVNAFIRKYLKMTAEDTLFLYINQSFAPMPDHCVSTLFDCFGSDGKLVIHYSKTQAWG